MPVRHNRLDTDGFSEVSFSLTLLYACALCFSTLIMHKCLTEFLTDKGLTEEGFADYVDSFLAADFDSVAKDNAYHAAHPSLTHFGVVHIARDVSLQAICRCL